MTEKAQNLKNLRALLASKKCDGFLLPRHDCFLQEYLSAASERLAWLTGFSGSYGFAVILREQAAFFSDGRYKIQMAKEVDKKYFDLHDVADLSPVLWLKKWAKKNHKDKKPLLIGYDPSQFSINGLRKIEKDFKETPFSLRKITPNPIDILWENRPTLPLGKVRPHPLQFSGENSQHKREKIAKAVKAQGGDAVFLNDPASIAWLLNLRADDIPFMPVALCFLLLHSTGRGDLFIDLKKINAETKKFLGLAITLHPFGDLKKILSGFAGVDGKKIILDPQSTSANLLSLLKKATIIEKTDPCLLAKACRNQTECKNLRLAHQWDGAAMVKFLSWLEKSAQSGDMVRELDAEKKLETFRSQHPEYRGNSFQTISAAGAHGAIIHYHPTQKSNAIIGKNDLYLVDSGGQYRQATTDITRTVLFGNSVASDSVKQLFTSVLQGHIALASICFPVGTTGGHLDSLARAPLWQRGINYNHGTGHGVGSYLGVHEGPQSISAKHFGVALKKGMVLSNEPGCYLKNQFGIRLENLLLVVEASQKPHQQEKFLAFENLTWVPFDRSLIDKTLLSETECLWLNSYHQKTHDILLPLLNQDEDKKWLLKATKPL